MIKKYITGKGLDTGRTHTITEAEHWYREPDNLYLPTRHHGIEKYDYLFSKDLINETKYYRILLYEWFLLVKPRGYLIIELEDNSILDYAGLKSELGGLSLYRGKYVVSGEQSEGKTKRIVIEKTESIKREYEEINRWTFGIVTNGKRKEFLEKGIESIRQLKVPFYEIVICGTYHGAVEDDIRYINFSEKDDRGWITKKKNLICENARYENIVIIHDRIFFDGNWFESMKKWGNYFEVLSCPVVIDLNDGTTMTTNWETLDENFTLQDDYKLFHTNGRLDASDWDKNVIVPGPLIILKRHVWSDVRWDEDLFWGEAEDIEYSHRQYRNGIMIRFNPYSVVRASGISGITYGAYYEKDKHKLGRFHPGISAPYVMAFRALDMFGFRRNQKVVKYLIKKAKRFYGASSWKEEGRARQLK